jgi:hypothetical protein
MTKPIAARSLLITYRSEPANRPAFRVYLQREERALGRRDEIVAKVRQTLVGDPAWKALSDIKQTIRTESENTVAESLTP